MRKRLLSAGVGMLIFFAVYFLSDSLLLNLAIAALSVLALYEIFVTTKYVQNFELIILSFIFAVGVPFIEYLKGRQILLITFLFVISLFTILLFNHKKYKIEHISVVFLVSIMISFFFTNIIMVRRMENGDIYFWLIFLGSWMNDTFAYFTGILIGKHKLAPEISPKKTVEGFWGGVIGTVASFIAFGYILGYYRGISFNIPILAFLGLICAIVAVIGDLSASVIKRQFNAKDFGNILPGHGGVMDRFDSVMFVAPLVYCFLQYISILVS